MLYFIPTFAQQASGIAFSVHNQTTVSTGFGSYLDVMGLVDMDGAEVVSFLDFKLDF